MHVLRKITYYMYRIGFATGQDEFDQKPVSVHTRKLKPTLVFIVIEKV